MKRLKRRELMEPIETALGRVVIAWNDLHDSMGWIFSRLVGVDSNLGFPIWNSVIADRGQREMLRAAAWSSPVLDNRAECAEDIDWLCKQTDGLSGKRNDAIHAPYKPIYDAEGKGEVRPFYYLGNPRAIALSDKDLMEQLVWFYLSFECLHRYAEEINTALLAKDLPWPERPQMPTLGQKGTQRP